MSKVREELSVQGLVLISLVTISLASCPDKCKCANLKIDCSSQDLQDVPHFSLDLQKSVFVDLRTNSIQKLTMNSFTNLFNVQTLILQFNIITEIEEGTFSNMLSLKTLDLSGNQFKTLPRDIFTPLVNLHSLDLSQNYITNLDNVFSSLKKLYRLDLAHNNLAELTDKTFTDLQGLMYLMLGNNRITSISKNAFSPLTKLSYLVLKNNPLYNVDHKFLNNRRMSYADLTNCKLFSIPKGLPWVLRYLQLTQNNITSISKESMKGYNYIAVIVLDQNKIHSVEPEAFFHMTYLRQLWMNGNKLISIPEKLPLNLNFLYLDANEITNLHGSVFAERSKLLTLSIKGNQIQHISAKHFNKMSDITKLYLDNNNLTEIEDFTFKSLGKLQHLFISRNPLKSLPRYSLFGLRELQFLEMAFVITDVDMHDMIFSKTPKLSKLELQYSTNLAKKICNSKTILKTLNNLTELNLLSAELSTLSPILKDELPTLEKLQLADNKWHCDRDLLWLNHWMRTAKTLFLNKLDVKCFSPHSLHGKTISSMFDYEFVPVTTQTTTMSTTEVLTTSSETTTTSPKVLSSKSSTAAASSQTNPVTTLGMTTTTTLTTTTFLTSTTVPETTVKTTPTTSEFPATTLPTTSRQVPKVTMATENQLSTTGRTTPTEIPKTEASETSTRQTTQKSTTLTLTTRLTISQSHATKPPKFSQTTGMSDLATSPARLSTVSADGRSKVPRDNITLHQQSVPTTGANITTIGMAPKKDDQSGKTTAIATSITVIILVLILIGIGIFIFRYRKNRVIYHRAIHYKQHSDMMYFITVSESETKPIKGPNRSERGSSSSVPSEDITNEEGGIKVYHWDGEK